MSSLKKKTIQGFFWSATERFSAQGMQFVLGVIIARLLAPTDYGLIGMLAIFLAISQTFIDSGFSTALIQKKDRDEKDFATTFYFNIVVALFFYALLYFCAPLIANFYEQPLLTPLARVVGLSIVINAFGVVQLAKFTIKVDFKTQAKASVTSILISGLAGLYMAYTGYGVWALVVQSLTKSFFNVALLWLISKWIPKERFSKERFKELFSFGSKLLAAGLLDTTYRNIYLIVIGKIFPAQTLGYYTHAQQFKDFPSSNLTGILQRVTFPILSEMQDDDERLKESYRKIIKLSALIIFPLMMGLAALAEPLIRVLLTDKWIESAWMLQLLCFAGMWYPIHAINLNVINVKGRSDLFLKLEIIKKAMITIVLVVSIPLGIKAIILGQIITSYLALIINTYYTKQIINYGFLRQMKDLSVILCLSFVMGSIVFISISYIDTTEILKLVMGFGIGLIFYCGTVWLFNIGDIKELTQLVTERSF